MTLTVTPRGPYSRAAEADSASIPAFAAATCACSGNPVYWKVADRKIILPPVEGFLPVFGFLAADAMRCGIVTLSVLNDPRVSISRTDLKALDESPEMGARKFPAAPALKYH